MSEKVACSFFVNKDSETVEELYPRKGSTNTGDSLLCCREGAFEFQAVLCVHGDVCGDKNVNVGHDDRVRVQWRGHDRW
jgi:hypothetical protein